MLIRQYIVNGGRFYEVTFTFLVFHLFDILLTQITATSRMTAAYTTKQIRLGRVSLPL